MAMMSTLALMCIALSYAHVSQPMHLRRTAVQPYRARHSAVLMSSQFGEEAKQKGYTALLDMMLTAESQFNISQADFIMASYEKVDYTFLQKLAVEVEAAETMADRKAKLISVQEGINAEMGVRMKRSADSLKRMLGSGPAGMFKLIPDYMQRGLIEEPLLLLLDANIKQATAAGAVPAATLMSRLLVQIRLEIDKAVEPEVRLLRELLRIDTSAARTQLLKLKFAPKSTGPAILIAGERKQRPKDTGPDVQVRKFTAALMRFKEQFGNIDEEMQSGLIEKLDAISAEAEAVAREFGVGSDMTPQQLQDLMMQKAMVSVWDLEKVEDDFASSGSSAPWSEENAARTKGLSSDDLML